MTNKPHGKQISSSFDGYDVCFRANSQSENSNLFAPSRGMLGAGCGRCYRQAGGLLSVPLTFTATTPDKQSQRPLYDNRNVKQSVSSRRVAINNTNISTKGPRTI